MRANQHTPDGSPVTAEWLIMRLDEAGVTLLSLPMTGHSTQLRVSKLDWATELGTMAAKPYNGKLRPATPTPAQISRMDETLSWISLLPPDRFVLRRILGARLLIDPLTGRHVFTWRRLGRAVGADHKAVQRWHAQGVDLLVKLLNGAPR